MIHKLRRRLVRRWRLLRGLELDGAVLVYQMGKVASTSVFHSLLDAPGVNAYHVHRMYPDNIARMRKLYLERGMPPLDDAIGDQLWRRLVAKGRSADVISLVREPIGRNVSAFFEGLDDYMGVADAHRAFSADELAEAFLERYMHELGVEWFDRELGPSLGIDVYASHFARDLGVQVIEAEPYRLLLMRHDLPDPEKEQAIASFLGLPEFRLKRVNEASTKDYASVYGAVKAQVRVPSDYADAMLGSRYARHFYSADELADLRARWTA